MIKFKEFLHESHLHVMDIDDTLLHTNAQIHVKDAKGKTVKKLSNQEFNDHKLEKGHHYDFSEFRDSDKFNKESKPIQPMLDTLNRIHGKIKNKLSPNSRVIMNTARSDFDHKEPVLAKFKQHGVDMDSIHIHRSGNEAGNDLPAKKKLVAIRKHLDSGKYKHAHMYDDSKTNLNHFLGLQKEYPHIKFHAWHVDENGKMRSHK